MTKAEAEKILLEVLPKLNPTEQTALNLVLNGKFDKPDLRVEVIDENHQKFNGEIYVKHKNGYYHIWKTLHKEVMKYYNGEIPSGCVVHHNKKTKDGRWDRDKNNIEDLSIVTNAEHSAIHKERKIIVKPKKAICAVCGREFFSKFHGGKNRPFLCSKKCKSIWVKNQTEERICVVCGKTFLICKYKNVLCCSRHCGNILGHRNRKEK